MIIHYDSHKLSEEDEKQIVERFLPALPNNHWAHKLYQEVQRLREKRQIHELIEGTIQIDETVGTMQFRFRERE